MRSHFVWMVGITLPLSVRERLPFIWEEPLAVLFAATESDEIDSGKPRRRFYVQEPLPSHCPRSRMSRTLNLKWPTGCCLRASKVSLAPDTDRGEYGASHSNTVRPTTSDLFTCSSPGERGLDLRRYAFLLLDSVLMNWN